MTDFLLAVLAAEQSASVRLSIVDSLGRNSNPKVRQELARLAASDADVRVSLLALERLRTQLAQDARDLLEKRLELAHRGGDQATAAKLAAAQERWISLVNGTMLPSFLRVPPARFSVKPDNLVGHDHILNHIKPEAGVQFFVSGGGGASLYKVKPGPRSLFAQSINGFTIVQADSSSLTVRFIGADSKQLYEYSLQQIAAGGARVWVNQFTSF